MLDVFQLSDLWRYKDSMPDCKEKQLLNSLLFEYEEYTKCGTPEECKSRLEWMTYSLYDIRHLREQTMSFITVMILAAIVVKMLWG